MANNKLDKAKSLITEMELTDLEQLFPFIKDNLKQKNEAKQAELNEQLSKLKSIHENLNK